MKKILPILLLGAVCLAAMPERNARTIFMIGDSTMANKKLDGGNQERGWGQMLQAMFDSTVVVDNHAVNGRSSKSFIDEGRWQTVLERIKPGDYLVIQFGHNDEKADSARHTDPGSTFDANLRRFVLEARAKGAKPVLMNSIVRRNFSTSGDAVAADDYRKAKLAEKVEGDTLIDTHGEYRLVPQRIAKELGVEFVDMNTMTHELVSQLGREESKKIFMWIEPGVCEACPEGRQDNTHLNIPGATQIAAMAADSLVKHFPELQESRLKK